MFVIALLVITICSVQAKTEITVKEIVKTCVLKRTDPLKSTALRAALSQAQKADIMLFLEKFQKERSTPLIVHLYTDGSKIDEKTPILVEIGGNLIQISERHQLLTDRKSKIPSGVYDIEVVLKLHGKPFLDKVEVLKSGAIKATVSIQLYAVLRQGIKSDAMSVGESEDIALIDYMNVVIPIPRTI